MSEQLEASVQYLVPAEQSGLEPERLEALIAAASGFVTDGPLPNLQFALARGGRLLVEVSLGEVVRAGTPTQTSQDTLFVAFSTTKAIIASALWLLFQDGKLDLEAPVAEFCPEFGTLGKEVVTVRHLLTHTAGFPDAPFAALDWNDPARRYGRFAKWRLDWPPGSRIRYHATAAHWVLAELIERTSRQDFRAFIRERIAEPLGIDSRLYVGLPESEQGRVADVVHVGESNPEQLRAMGIELPPSIGKESYLERFNEPDIRAVGVPGAGGLMTAGGLALFYQALLSGCGPGGDVIWTEETLRHVLEPCTGELIDPMTRKAAHRCLGLVVSGDDDRVFRSFGPINSPAAFGHSGVGGQVAWADPATGLSFVSFTSGVDRNLMMTGIRGISLSTHAAACMADDA